MYRYPFCNLPTRGLPISTWLLASALGFALCAHAEVGVRQLTMPTGATTFDTPMDVEASVALKAAAWPALNVNASRDTGIYVARAHDTLYFWAVDEINGRIEHIAQLAINPAAGQDIVIDLGSTATGLIYADNLFQPGEQLRFIFNGKLQKAKIAIPMAETHFQPLFSVLTLGQVVVVSPTQTSLQAIIDTQVQIYQIADQVDAMQDNAAGHFAHQAQGQLINATNALVANNTAMVNLINAAQTSTTGLQSQFTQQLNADQNSFNAALNEAQGFVSSELNNMANVVIPCVQTAQTNAQADVDTLEVQVGDTPQTTTAADPALEASVDSSEAYGDQQDAAMDGCSDPTTLENSTVSNPIGSTGAQYSGLATSAGTISNTAIAQSNTLAQNANVTATALALNVQSNNSGANVLEYPYYFEPWISPLFASSNRALDEQAMAQDALTASELALPVRNGKAALAAQLCQSASFVFQFDLGFVAVVIGTPWQDRIIAGKGNNVVLAFAGDDCVEGHAGHDTVLAGSGNDKVFAGDDHDFVFGGNGDDEIHGSAGVSYTANIQGTKLKFDVGNLIFGGSGNDQIYGGESNADAGENGSVESFGFADVLFGDSGNDVIDGEMGIDFVFGQQGDDRLINLGTGVVTTNNIPMPFGSLFYGDVGNDMILGTNSQIAGIAAGVIGDWIMGGTGDDVISANGGNDLVLAGNGKDNVSGGDGIDFIFGDVDAFDADVLDGNAGEDVVLGMGGNDTIYGSTGLLDVLFGGMGNDAINGGAGANLSDGGEGNDTITGGNDFDTLIGGSSGDLINGNDGIDIVFGGSGQDVINGGTGSDFLDGSFDTDIIHGNADIDVILGGSNSTGVESLFGDAGIDLVFGNDGDDQLYGGTGYDLLAGGDGVDSLYGEDDSDWLLGGIDSDQLTGGSGWDILSGELGNDQLNGGLGSDWLNGGDGNDQLNGADDGDLLVGNDGDDNLLGGVGRDALFGSAGQDCLRGNADIDAAFGGGGADYIAGDDSFNWLNGGDDNDYLLGGLVSDVIRGGSGDDYANGGDDRDYLSGNDGNDILVGGNGNDLLRGRGGDDQINGENGNDWSFGGPGNDQLLATAGRNLALGNQGNDTVDGYDTASDPIDFLFGNLGNDTVTGNGPFVDVRWGGFGVDNMFVNVSKVTATFVGQLPANATCQ